MAEQGGSHQGREKVAPMHTHPRHCKANLLPLRKWQLSRNYEATEGQRAGWGRGRQDTKRERERETWGETAKPGGSANRQTQSGSQPASQGKIHGADHRKGLNEEQKEEVAGPCMVCGEGPFRVGGL